MKLIYVSTETWTSPLSSAQLFRRDLRSFPVLPREEVLEIGLEMKQLQHGSDGWLQLRNTLVEHNTGLVFKIAFGYQRRGLEYDDLVQEGMLGLTRAAELYDATLGFSFSTYAHNWIHQAMSRAIADKGRTIRIPVHLSELMGKVLRTQREFWQEKRRPPSSEEMADSLHLSVQQIEKVLRAIEVSKTAYIDDLTKDSETGDDRSDSAAFLGVAPTQEVELEFLGKKELGPLQGLLRDGKTLTPREQMVIVLLAGLDGHHVHTLEEVGVKFSVTRERIRQIKLSALTKLREAAARCGIRAPETKIRVPRELDENFLKSIDWDTLLEKEPVEQLSIMRITSEFRSATDDVTKFALERDSLKGTLRLRPVEAILQVIAGAYGTTSHNLRNGDSSACATWARQVAMFFLKKNHTNDQIAQALNRKTTQSVREACANIELFVEQEPVVAEDVRRIRFALATYGFS